MNKEEWSLPVLQSDCMWEAMFFFRPSIISVSKGQREKYHVPCSNQLDGQDTICLMVYETQYQDVRYEWKSIFHCTVSEIRQKPK
jgi:hypothetical protein